jgi:His/Glu/Gln/Arg/opine family amino acid ABC transporter permease subunit
MTFFDILRNYRQAFASGLLVTAKLALLVWFIGIAGGLLIGFLADKYRRSVGMPMAVFAFLLSGVPIIVLLFWAHFPLQVLLGVVIDPFITAVWVLALVNAFSVADAVRGVLRDFPEQYITAAKVCGLGHRTTLLRIKFPIVLRQLIPPLLNIQVTMLQATIFASLISVAEIFRVAQAVNASIYQPVQIYSSLALFFLAICLPLNGLALFLKSRFTRNLSDR